MKTKFPIIVLIVGLLTACASQPRETPASSPTGKPAPTTMASSPTDAVIAPTDVPSPTAEPVASPTAEAVAGVSFANDVLPILQSRCVNCHGGQRIEKGLSLNSYDNVMAGSENGAAVVPGDANNSLMAQLIQSGKMPKRGPKLTPPQLQTIVDWINQGALNN